MIRGFQKLIVAGLLVLSFSHSMNVTQAETLGGVRLEMPCKDLFVKAASSSKDFTEEEIRLLINYTSVPTCGLDERDHVARGKLIELGESIYPILSERALKQEHPCNAASIVSLFGFAEREWDRTEARQTTLKVFEKFPVLWDTRGTK